ncbi:unnamed protein product [Parnassius apollo]|uniref:(apollo) hypothetical protein n=1 Tax=Parnassius apollo TaxID=110799 RepID=A0A8S3WM71_PARAO|nr:unnamed protein product [Parnassius apollo]
MNFDTVKFIIEIQNRPCLWDSSSNDYSDRNLKIKGWGEIVNIFKEKDEMKNQEKKQQKVVALRKPEVVASKESKATDPDPEKDMQEDRQVGSCPKRMKTKQKTTPEDDKFLEALNESIKSREQYELGSQDEDRLFMLSLVSTLKNCLLQKMATRIKIMTILEEAARSMPNIDDSALYCQSYWSQQTEPPPSRSYHPGYSTVRGETL